MVDCAEVTDRGEKSRLGDESPKREEEVRRSVVRPTGKKRAKRFGERKSKSAMRSGGNERERDSRSLMRLRALNEGRGRE
jgi:hypothetical protein